ncbi:sugar transferase [Campylobacter lari]|nr:sugar transferase [Campylobacter lari]
MQINEYFIIDNQSYICTYADDNAIIAYPTYSYTQVKETNLGIVAFLFAENKRIVFDFKNDQNFKLTQEYDFTYLLDFLIEGKNFIEDYNKKQDIVRVKPLQSQIATLMSEKQNLQVQITQLQNVVNSLALKKQQVEISNLEQDLINKKFQTKQLSEKLNIRMNDFISRITMINPNSAKSRIQNQLSYKLGQAMIVNSKSFLGYIRMPFVLSYIKDKHKQEQKIYQEKIKKDPSLALPPLEDYPDYKEALKLKNHLSYKLGQALIQANKTWYKGGYVKLWFEIGKLKREYKNKKI